MALTPVEIRHIRSSARSSATSGHVDRRSRRSPRATRTSGATAPTSATRSTSSRRELVRFRELEALLRTTLVSAERASQELKEQARKESELLLTEAHAEARAVTRRAHAEREHLAAEARRIRSLLRSALEALAVEDAEPTEEREAA